MVNRSCAGILKCDDCRSSCHKALHAALMGRASRLAVRLNQRALFNLGKRCNRPSHACAETCICSRYGFHYQVCVRDASVTVHLCPSLRGTNFGKPQVRKSQPTKKRTSGTMSPFPWSKASLHRRWYHGWRVARRTLALASISEVGARSQVGVACIPL